MDNRIIQRKLDLLRGKAVVSSQPVAGWSVRTAIHRAPNSYDYDGPWQETALPMRFPAGKTVFLKARPIVPADAPLADTYISVDFNDMEGLLSVNGKPYAGVDSNHQRALAPAAGTLDVELEFLACPQHAWRPGPVGAAGQVSGISVVTVDRNVESLYDDLLIAWQAWKVAPEGRRKLLLERGIENAMLALDLTLEGADFTASVAESAETLASALAGIAGDPESGTVFVSGHTHIDVAWLWPLRETVRKTARTFATACRLMERYPDYRFACSQAQLYSYVKEFYPDLYEEVKKWVAAGRWETTGAMWLESDCNVPSGEALVRQMLYGIQFFKKEFGTRPRICWLPDVFGYPASLPDILAACGVDRFYTAKLYWQSKNGFPHQLFRWRGLDGSEVLAALPFLWANYNGYPNPDQIAYAWEHHNEKADHTEVLFPFGYGDGGGGVTEGMMESVVRLQKGIPGLPAVRSGTPEEYFDRAEAVKPDLPVWDGELYLETHRGTLTSQARVKKANRKCELMLRDAEIFGVLAEVAGKRADWETLADAWRTVLLLQFHDILPGSSINMVYAEAIPSYSEVLEGVGRVLSQNLAAVTPSGSAGAKPGLCVFNTLSWPRIDATTAVVPSMAGPVSLVGQRGDAIAAQVVARGDKEMTVVFEPDGLPAFGSATYEVRSGAVAHESNLHVSTTRIETSHYRLELTPDGGISRLYDKANAREVLAPDSVGNDLQLFQDGPEGEDAWNVHPTSTKRRYPFEGETSVEVVEAGPVRGVVRIRRRRRTSVFEQDVTVYARTPRIDFVTRVDWQERQTMLKVAFPLAVRATRATYEVQFGAVERPTHRNTLWDEAKFEVCGQRWADISESGYGVSLLNDCKYGYDAIDNVLRLTLLRGTTSPDPHADLGQHEFTYSLLPHAGAWSDGGSVRRAWELNVPARSAPVLLGESVPAAQSVLTLEGTAIVEALKPAEDGNGFILRVYEPYGGRGEISIATSLPIARVLAVNAVEEPAGDPIELANGSFKFPIHPFEIRTFRLIPGAP